MPGSFGIWVRDGEFERFTGDIIVSYAVTGEQIDVDWRAVDEGLRNIGDLVAVHGSCIWVGR